MIDSKHDALLAFVSLVVAVVGLIFTVAVSLNTQNRALEIRLNEIQAEQQKMQDQLNRKQ